MPPLATIVPFPHRRAATRNVADVAPPRGPRRRQPDVSRYRAFTAWMFLVVAAVVGCLDTTAYAEFVGPAGIAIWAMTLAGSFGVGPVRTVWNAMHK